MNIEEFDIDEPMEDTFLAALNDVAKAAEELKLSILWQIMQDWDAVRCFFRELFRK